MTTAEEFKQKQKARFDESKNKPKPVLSTFRPISRKFPTKLHKALFKLEKQYDRFSKCPVRLARILKQGISIDKKMRKLERSKI